MTQKDKELLFKDICARLPYGVKVQHQHQDYLDEVLTIEHITRNYNQIETGSVLGFVDDFKPYLRPMSSMTEEERIAYLNACDNEMEENVLVQPRYSGIDWLNANHFDFRGLIPKGLAIEVNKNNNPYK